MNHSAQNRDHSGSPAIIEANVARIVQGLRVWANHMAGRYNGCVYLLGSTLQNPEPRDCDIRIVMDDHEFGARYGLEMKPTTKEGWTRCIAWDEDGPTQRWIDDVAKFNGRLSVTLKLNMDIQLWPDSYWRDGKIYPKPILLAGRSPHWWIYSAHCPDPSPPEPATEVEKP